MNIENISSDDMTLSYNGQSMQIKVYEDLIQQKDKEIERLNNTIEEKDKRIHLALGYMENAYPEPDWRHVYAILDGVDDNYED